MVMKGLRAWYPIVVVLLVGALGLSCARDPVTGKTTFTLLSESDEVAMGRQADPNIVAEYGVYPDEGLTAYVNDIGQKLAAVSHRPHLKYTFRVVDSPVVNAFALPGGFVYFTRGILAHFNSEAELAGVMGHEIGHVTARHGAEQYTKAQLAGVGLALGGALSEDFRKYSDLAQMGVGLLFLKFSRGNESESDRLGVEYSTKTGYDALHMARFFRTIGRITEQSGSTIPTFLSTHPNPANREQKVASLAQEWQQKVPGAKGGTDRAAYLSRIDGIVYGPDPRQGFVEGGYFYHPEMRFQFIVPANWQVANAPAQVQMMGPDKKAGIQFSLAKGASADQAATTFVTNAKATVVRRQTTRVNGLGAVELVSDLQSQSGALRLMSYFIEKDGKVFVFHGYTSPDVYPKAKASFARVMKSFNHLKNQAALKKQPKRLRIEKAKKAGTLRGVLLALGMKQDKLGELAILNGMNLQDRVKRGWLVKVVR